MAKKQKHIVMARTTDVMEKGLELEGQKMNFRKDSAVMWVNDPGKAKAIQEKYKGQVAVTLDQQYTWSENNDQGNGTQMKNIHNYTFQGVDLGSVGGNERVKVRTQDGYAYVSRLVAEEEGLEIVPQKRRRRRKSAEVTEDDKDTL